MIVENVVKINAPVEEVYAFTSDPSKLIEWQEMVESVDHEGEVTVGSQYTDIRKFLGQEMRTTMEITRVEPNKLYATKALSGPVHYEMTFSFEACDDGGTLMHTTVEGEPTGFFKMAERPFEKQLEKAMIQDRETLKEILEKA